MFYSKKRLQYKLVIEVTIGLFIFSIIAGIFTYQYAYKHELKKSIIFQKQLIRTIKSQAEVAVFVQNEEIGRDILNGLLTSPLLKAAKIESIDGIFKLEQVSEINSDINEKDVKEEGTDPLDIFQESDLNINFNNGVRYPLFSPVDSVEKIGSLIIVQNDDYISNEVKKVSIDQTSLMLVQLLMSALLIIFVSQRVISRPVSKLAEKVVAINPGDNVRIRISEQHSHDEIGMLSDSINSFIDAAENSLSESVAAKEEAERANLARAEFLDNSGEGFLSFGRDMLIDAEYSRECESIFRQTQPASNKSEPDSLSFNISSKNISELLFGQLDVDNSGFDPDKSADVSYINLMKKKDGFEKTIDLIFNEELDFKRELYISLLEPVYKIGNKHIKAKYKLISNDTKIMLILTDITREKILEKNVADERKRLKFVIAAVKDTADFFAVLDELHQFKHRKLPVIADKFRQDKSIWQDQNIFYEMYRNIHTFKGVFAQQEFLSFPQFLHKMETRLSGIISIISGMVVDEKIQVNINDDEKSQVNINDADSIKNRDIGNNIAVVNNILTFIDDFQNEDVLEQDLDIIRTFLGTEFIENKGNIIISSELALKIESMADNLILSMGGNIDDDTLEILQHIKCIRYVDIKSLLAPHTEGALRLAERVGKYINPFEVEGDEIFVHPDKFKSFTRSIVNVFRNAVDHGIEEPDERIEAEKDEYASIECKVKKMNIKNIDCVEITITDDGRGLDLNKIKEKAIYKGLISLDKVETLSKNEVLELIFLDDFSTKDNVDAMSGRGVGLSGVKKELEKLNGSVKIETEQGRGTCFKFCVPL